MKRRELTSRQVFVVAIALPALLFTIIVVLLGFPGAGDSKVPSRSKIDPAPAKLIIDPGTAFQMLRRGLAAGPKGGASGIADEKTGRSELIRLRDASLPVLRTGIYSESDSARFRLELIHIAGEIRTPAAEEFLATVFADRALDSRYRVLALTKISDRQSDKTLDLLVASLKQEDGFPARHLLVKAIGEGRRPDGAPLLLKAAREESHSVRLQAIDSLGFHLREPGILDGLQQLVLEDKDPGIQQSALMVLTRDPGDDVDRFLESLARRDGLDPELRAAASRWSELRRKKAK